MNRIKKGYLLINEKKHFVYEGLNLLGRSKDTTVILPDTTVSQSQSAIVIIEEKHLLSDLNSRNGTFLNDLHLTPLKLYEISVGSCIKFGAVNGVYYKIGNDVDCLENTQTDTVIASNIFSVPTQAFDNFNNKDEVLQNCREIVVENVEPASINDLPTQIIHSSDIEVCVKDNNEVAVSVHDLSTQIIDYAKDNLNASERDDNILVGHQNSTTTTTASNNVLIDETVLEELGNGTSERDTSTAAVTEEISEYDGSSRESIDFATMQPAATQLWSSSTASAESQHLLQQNVLQLERRVRNVIKSDDEESSSANKKEEEEEEEPLPVIDDDSSTNVDSDVEISSIDTKKQKTLGKRKSKYFISDSDSDIDLDVDLKRKKNKNGRSAPIIDSGSETDAENADEVCGSSSPSTTIAENLPPKEESVAVDTTTSSRKVDESTTNLNDSDIIPMSQQPIVQFSHSQIRRERPVESTKNFEASLTDSFQLVLTNSPTNSMLIANDDENNEDEGTKECCIVDDGKITTATNKEKRNSANISLKISNDEDEIRNVLDETPTQEINFDDNIDNLLLPAPSNETAKRPENPLLNILNNSLSDEQHHDRNESANQQNDNQLPTSYDSVESHLMEMFAPTQNAPPDQDENIFDLPTQRIGLAAITTSNEDAFIKPKPLKKLTKNIGHGSSLECKFDEDDSIFLQATQVLQENILAKSDSIEKVKDDCNDSANSDEDDIFLLPTQVTHDHFDNKRNIFSQPTQILDLESDKKKTMKSSNERSIESVQDDAIFLQPTQILGIVGVVKETGDMSDVKLDENVAKTIPEDSIFFQSTQILDINNVETSKKSAASKENLKRSKIQLEKKLTSVSSIVDQKISNPLVEDDGANKENAQIERNTQSRNSKITNEHVKEEEIVNATTKIENVSDGDDGIFSLSTQILTHHVDKADIDDDADAASKMNENDNSEISTAGTNANTKQVLVEKEGNAAKKVFKEDDDELAGTSWRKEQINDDTSDRRTRNRKTKSVLQDEDVKDVKKMKINEEEKEEEQKQNLEKTKEIPLRRSKRKTSTEESTTIKCIGEGVEKKNNVPEEVLVSRRRSKRQKSVDELTPKSNNRDTENLYVIKEIENTDNRKMRGVVKKGAKNRKASPSTVSTNSERNSPLSVIVEEKSSVGIKGPRTSKRNVTTENATTTSKKDVTTERPSKAITTPIISTTTRSAARTNKNIITATPSTSRSDDKETNSDDDFIQTPSRMAKKVDTPSKKLKQDESNSLLETPKSTSKRSTRKTTKTIVQRNTDDDDDDDDDGLSSRMDNESTASSSSSTADSKRARKTPRAKQEEHIANTEMSDKSIRTAALLSTTPDRNKRKLKPKIVFTMLDSPQLETIIRSLGGIIVDSVQTSTVLLTGSVKRSQKLLSAVGQAKPICSPIWLHESKKANTFLDPWEYILEDKEAEEKWHFSLKESLRRSSERKLFEGYTFQLMVNTAQDVLKGSIEACGGKCVSRAPSSKNTSFDNFVVVASADNKSKYARLLKQCPVPKIVTAEAVFDGVLRQQLHFDDHSLT